MSLHINLILETEQRSASLISPIFVVRLIGILIPVAALFFGGMAHLQSRHLRNELSWAEEDWQNMQPRNRAAQELQRDLVRIREVESEITGWRNSRFSWPGLLRGIQAIVPPTIQFTQLQSEERLQLDGTTLVRRFTLKINGRARGENPESDVASLRNHMMEHPALAEIVRRVTIQSFGADPDPRTDRAHRVFQINVDLKPGRFE